MPKRNREYRRCAGGRGLDERRKRSVPRSISRPSAQQTPSDSNCPASLSRQLPGFVWDAERGRYFPESSRAADRIERQNEEREQQRVSAIAAAQEKQRHRSAEQCIARQAILRRQATYSHGCRPGAPWEYPWQRNSRDRVLLGYVLSNKVAADWQDREQQMTAIGSFSRCSLRRSMVAVGDQTGHVTIMDRNNDSILIHNEQADDQAFCGEITGIQWASPEYLVFSSLGSDRSHGCVAVYSSRRREKIHRHVFSDSVFSVSCSKTEDMVDAASAAAGQSLLISAGTGGGMSIVHVGNTGPHEVFKIRTDTDVLSTAFIDGPNVVACGGRDGRIRLIDHRVSVKSHKRSRGLLATDDCRHGTSVHGLRSSQGWLLASASMDSQVRIWDVRMTHRMGSQQQKLPSLACLNNPVGQTEHMLAPCRLGFSACLDVVVAASSDNHVRMWSMTSGSLLHVVPLAADGGPCRALDLDYDPSAAEAALYICQQSLLTSYSHRFK
ncbi:hypothetical protein LPJ56_001293 [Coemansia sp. RSA 2599]|nr:hypothetical protein LPJ56_001293 [Coemansia sp. RSA 2599]